MQAFLHKNHNIHGYLKYTQRSTCDSHPQVIIVFHILQGLTAGGMCKGTYHERLFFSEVFYKIIQHILNIIPVILILKHCLFKFLEMNQSMECSP